jgi:hypothetical protein
VCFVSQSEGRSAAAGANESGKAEIPVGTNESCMARVPGGKEVPRGSVRLARDERMVGGTPMALVRWTSHHLPYECGRCSHEGQADIVPGTQVLNGSCVEHSAVARLELTRRDGVGIVQEVAA